MTATDYTIRDSWASDAGHSVFAVVDRHGRLAHVTVTREAAVNGWADVLIRARLAALPPHRVTTR